MRSQNVPAWSGTFEEHLRWNIAANSGGKTMRDVGQLVRTARAGIENLAPADLARELASRDVLLVDVREPGETSAGVIEGAVVVPRGMLEFRADPSTSYYLKGFDRE